MTALLALAPLVTVVAAMVGLGWSAARAGGVALLVAAAVALTAFDLAGAVPEARAGVGIALEATHATAVILWIVLPALALYEYQRATGAIERIRTALAGLTDDRRLQAVLIAWFFGLFMEGAAGFGTPLALAAPLLVGLGFAPVRAVTLALLGHAAGVSFGAVGTPLLTQAEITGLSGSEIAAATAALHAALGWILLVAVVRLAGDTPLSRRELAWSAFAALAFLLPYLAIATFAGPELPALGGALVGLSIFVPALRRRGRSHDDIGGGHGRAEALAHDLVPYLAILVLVLLTRLVPALRDALGEIELGWSFAGAFEGTFQPLYHPGTLLFTGFLIGAAVTGRTARVVPAGLAAVRRLLPVASALLAMLALSRTMVHAGMVDALAEAAALSGAFWPLVAPVVGALGTFVTGSATASNILFSEFQTSTAAVLSLPPVAMLAAQGFGAAIGNVVAPHNIIAGCATVGLAAREGEILSRTAPICLLYALLGGALLAVLL